MALQLVSLYSSLSGIHVSLRVIKQRPNLFHSHLFA